MPCTRCSGSTTQHLATTFKTTVGGRDSEETKALTRDKERKTMNEREKREVFGFTRDLEKWREGS